ncbi:MAG TPA: rhodanese-like domain-containing protein [Ramlibacter sp.]|nr:rhodanese-like domain-containing protein [Ramlibacter sp.]
MDTVTSPHPHPPSVSRAQLAGRLGRPGAPLVLDVRRTPRFLESDRMVATARHVAPEAVADFAASERPREVVVYCAYGHEVGREAAAVLQAAGWPAAWLAGGIEGGEDGVDDPDDIRGWRSQPLPAVHKAPRR